jgi:hypothetical protein
MNHFFYARHFLLLACFSVFLAVVSRLHLTCSLPVSFALYGSLHASALVLALRARQAIWRSCLFIVIAASLSVMTLRFGIFGRQLSGTPPGIVGLYSLLGLSAVIGAVTYGILIRLFGMYALTTGSLAAIAVGCVLAAFAALFTGSHFHFLGPWWVAVLWWHAFSGGLWYFDQRRHRASIMLAGPPPAMQH